MTTDEFRIAVFEGDGIGPEIMTACLSVLKALEVQTGGFRLIMESLPAGFDWLRRR